MKTTHIAMFATLMFALPTMAQSTFVSGAIENGDLEVASLAPQWGGPGASHSTGVIADHTTGTTAGGVMCIDLTANNGAGQWKGITTNPAYTVASDQEKLTESVWVYIPAATTFGPTANLNLNIQRSLDNRATWGNIGGVPITAFQSLNLKTAARDTWIQVAKVNIDLPAGTTDIRLNHNIQTVVEVNGLAADGGADGSGGVGPATPADWNTEGYSGVIYVDDFFLESAPVVPPPAGTLICDNFGNGNFESALLAPWNPARGAGDIDTVIVQEGTQSMSVDLAADGLASNRWRGFQLTSTLPAVDGDMIGTAAWIYVPSTTTFGPAGADFNAELRSDNGNGGNGFGNLAGQLSVDLTSLATDQWVLVTALTEAVDGVNPISEINLTGWNIETANGVDQAALGYTGKIYFDDIKLINVGPGPVSDGPGVMVGPNDSNGDMDGDFPAPWDGIAPWVVSGAGTGTTSLDHTSGSGSSVCVDLTVNNSNERWKGMHNTLPELDIISLGYDRADISAWVYVPAATTFGGPAKFNMPIRDGAAAAPGGPSIDLTTVTRDTWVEVSGTGIDLSAFATSLAINNWNIETTNLLDSASSPGMTVRSDGSDGTTAAGTTFDPLSDLPGPAVPADWIQSGYSGVFYFDDVSVVAYAGTVSAPLEINNITRDNGTGQVTINYNSTFPDGADVYRSDDELGSWTFDGAALGTGDNQDYVTTPGVPERLYILVEPFTVPADPTP